MGAAVKTGNYVHLVATINVETGKGQIHYVNPVGKILESDAATDPSVELVVKNAASKELYRSHVVVRRSSPEPDGSSDIGLIQADIPAKAGMASVGLYYKNEMVDEYVAGTPPEPQLESMTLSLGGPVPGGLNRLPMSVTELGHMPPIPGVTYTVQVKPDGQDVWNTIAVGRPTPSVEIDRNQFPGASKADVRVLRTTGFTEEVIAADTIDF
jgi:hypothetical protein